MWQHMHIDFWNALPANSISTIWIFQDLPANSISVSKIHWDFPAFPHQNMLKFLGFSCKTHLNMLDFLGCFCSQCWIFPGIFLWVPSRHPLKILSNFKDSASNHSSGKHMHRCARICRPRNPYPYQKTELGGLAWMGLLSQTDIQLDTGGGGEILLVPTHDPYNFEFSRHTWPRDFWLHHTRHMKTAISPPMKKWISHTLSAHQQTIALVCHCFLDDKCVPASHQFWISFNFACQGAYSASQERASGIAITTAPLLIRLNALCIHVCSMHLEPHDESWVARCHPSAHPHHACSLSRHSSRWICWTHYGNFH